MVFAALELGSDIGGSIRIPAACCGVVGFRPAENRLPRTGHIPHLPGQPRSVLYAVVWPAGAHGGRRGARHAQLLAGADGEDQEVPPLPWRPQPADAALRLAWCDDFAGLPLCLRTCAGLTQALAGARAAGYQLLRRQPAGPPLAQVWRRLACWLAAKSAWPCPPDNAGRWRWLGCCRPASRLRKALPKVRAAVAAPAAMALGVRDALAARAGKHVVRGGRLRLCPTLLYRLASQPATAPWRPAGAAEYRRAARPIWKPR